MNKLFLLFVMTLGLACARGEALDPKLVPADAKWVLHLDAEAFRQSKLGAMVVKDVLEPKVEKAESDLKSDLNFSFKKISSLTAFGARMGEGADREGALLVRTTADIKQDLQKIMAKMAAGPDAPALTKLDDGSDLYSVGDLFATEASANLWVVSKNKRSLAAAREVATGKNSGGLPSKMTAYPSITNSYFFLAVAETAAEGLPAQAALLKKAEGARFAVGERSDKLFLELALKAKDDAVRTQLQQALQGLIAFISLAKPDDKDLMSLANSAAVANADGFVTVSLSFPLERAMQKVREDNDL